MDFFPWLPLLFNLLLLCAVMFVCRTINASHGKLLWNGALVFFIFCFLAMALDFVLTMVFASASFHDHTQYESIATRSKWSERVLSYLIPCVVSALLAQRFRKRQRAALARKRRVPTLRNNDAPVSIKTSPYTQSELRL
ncbi:hypothetical protein P9250_24280 [Caballeronia sp. LP006]|jgi:bacteriorhodopsin|uniref:hypothetical protein n=1 Tax=unclassified Caballeronia TaxID=2646786 RepID=UPI001FD00055|nr:MULTISPECIES: hypothetical protein [unclassified Caballeronia]MDR5771684.1 hypothetical protein [Caballeronia sp. LZ002]MDR5805469.1 hypothetical protein [Caballeronia sp. LZ001]MDR5830994.1 hypothetical protein [Caballeronia sp. LP006]MDR5847119.1 hypothetical protein [Caballeronia sp. LZ003]